MTSLVHKTNYRKKRLNSRGISGAWPKMKSVLRVYDLWVLNRRLWLKQSAVIGLQKGHYSSPKV